MSIKKTAPAAFLIRKTGAVIVSPDGGLDFSSAADQVMGFKSEEYCF